MKTFFRIAGLIFLLVGPSALAATKVGQPAPALEIITAGGKPFSLEKLKGKPAIIHFWATWCPGCRLEMPILDGFYRKNATRVEMIGLSVDRSSDRATATKQMSVYAFPWAMLLEAKTNDFGSPRALPITYVIDAQGIVKKIFLPGDESAEESLTEKNLNTAVGSN